MQLTRPLDTAHHTCNHPNSSGRCPYVLGKCCVSDNTGLLPDDKANTEYKVPQVCLEATRSKTCNEMTCVNVAKRTCRLYYLSGRLRLLALSTSLVSSRSFCTMNWAKSPTTLLLGVTCMHPCASRRPSLSSLPLLYHHSSNC